MQIYGIVGNAQFYLFYILCTPQCNLSMNGMESSIISVSQEGTESFFEESKYSVNESEVHRFCVNSHGGLWCFCIRSPGQCSHYLSRMIKTSRFLCRRLFPMMMAFLLSLSSLPASFALYWETNDAQNHHKSLINCPLSHTTMGFWHRSHCQHRSLVQVPVI